MILTSGDSISIFFRLLPYTTYIIPVAAFITAVVIGLSIRGKACRIERDYTRTSADITSVRRVSKRTHINYEYRDQSVSYTKKKLNDDKNAPFIYGGAVLLGTLVFLWRRR